MKLKNEYYVYGFIDPRDNEYFYIGKGKKERHKSHFKKSNQLDDTNHNKVNKIREIENLGYSVIVDIIFTELDERTAYELEMVLIYKLGREMFDEGKLTNILRGGIGSYNGFESYYYDKWYTGSFNLAKLSIVNRKKFNSIKKVSTNIKYVSYYLLIEKYKLEYELDYLYFYNNFGTYVKKETSKTSFDLFNPDLVEHEKYKFLKENKLPIFFEDYILSEIKNEKLYLSLEIPLSNYDIIDEDFHLNFDKLFRKEKHFKIELKVKNVVRMIVERNKNVINVNSFYSNGNKKSFVRTKNRKTIIQEFWNSNQNLKYKKELDKRSNTLIMTFYGKNIIQK